MCLKTVLWIFTCLCVQEVVLVGLARFGFDMIKLNPLK